LLNFTVTSALGWLLAIGYRMTLAALACLSEHRSEVPPFLIMHGSDDPVMPVEQSIAFDETLRAVDAESTLLIIEGAGHGFPRSELDPVKPFFDLFLL